MQILIGIISSISTTTVLVIIAFLAKNLIIGRLKLGLQKELAQFKLALQKDHSEYYEKLQWDTRVREQAARVAEYLALYHRLGKDSEGSAPLTDYQQANQLAWELTMWLPEDIFKEMIEALQGPTQDVNIFSVLVSVRKLLLGDEAGNLTLEEHAMVNWPGISKES